MAEQSDKDFVYQLAEFEKACIRLTAEKMWLREELAKLAFDPGPKWSVAE